MTALLNFTETATHYIKGWLIKEQGLGLRLSVKKTGCSGFSYAPAIISALVEGDIHFQVNPELNVYIDPPSLDYLKGLTVDYVEENKEGMLKQKKLVFVNPNEKSRCGCGESFHV